MAIIPGRYGGYGIRPPRPGSARRLVEPVPESWQNVSARAAKALAEPFRDVTTDGQVLPGLFALQQTSISTRPLKDAAAAFSASLTAVQKKAALHPMDSPEWRKWTNWEQYPLCQGMDGMIRNRRQLCHVTILQDYLLTLQDYLLTRSPVWAVFIPCDAPAA